MPLQVPAEHSETRPEWQRLFDQYQADEGAIVLLDRNARKVYRFNPLRCQTRFSPASTFKIFNSLVGLETGVIPDGGLTLPWDGVTRDFPGWNQDHDLASAFKYSVVWYYQEVARRVGTERMQMYLDREAYGNASQAGGIDQFWLGQGLQISPDEQVAFLSRLYHNQLGFSQRSMDVAKGIMLWETGDGYVIRAKTGWLQRPELQLGWLVGWVEKGDNVYFFATNVASRRADFDMVTVRPAITRAMLRDLGILP